MQDRNVFASTLKLGQLILRKIIKIVSIRCHILKPKCIKFDFGWGCAPDPAGELTALPQTPWLDLGALLLRRGRKGEVEGKGGKRREGKGKQGRPVFSVQFVGNPTLYSVAVVACLNVVL